MLGANLAPLFYSVVGVDVLLAPVGVVAACQKNQSALAGLRLPDASAIANLPSTTGFKDRGQLWLADNWRDLFAPRGYEAEKLNRRVVCLCRHAQKSGHLFLMHALIRGIRDDALNAR